MNSTPARQFALQAAAVIVVLSLAWPYYGWGAGYDTTGREQDIRLIYGAGTKQDLEKALQDKPIDYILVNDPVRNATNYVINESLIADTFPLVFDSPYEGTKIYQVRKNP